MSTYSPKPGDIERHVARHRRHRRRARPARDPGRHAAARQAQADLRAARGHRRLRHHRQRREGRAHRQQAHRQVRLPALRLPGRPAQRSARRDAREAARAGSSRRPIKGMLPKNKLGRADEQEAQGLRGPEHPHAAQQPVPFEITPGRAVTAETRPAASREDQP